MCVWRRGGGGGGGGVRLELYGMDLVYSTPFRFD